MGRAWQTRPRKREEKELSTSLVESRRAHQSRQSENRGLEGACILRHAVYRRPSGGGLEPVLQGAYKHNIPVEYPWTDPKTHSQ